MWNKIWMIKHQESYPILWLVIFSSLDGVVVNGQIHHTLVFVKVINHLVIISPLSMQRFMLYNMHSIFFSCKRLHLSSGYFLFCVHWHLIPPFVGASDMSQYALWHLQPVLGPWTGHWHRPIIHPIRVQPSSFHLEVSRVLYTLLQTKVVCKSHKMLVSQKQHILSTYLTSMFHRNNYDKRNVSQKQLWQEKLHLSNLLCQARSEQETFSGKSWAAWVHTKPAAPKSS